MITIDTLLSLDKNDLQEASKAIEQNDLSFLVELLSEKNDNIRYHSLLLLQDRSANSDDVYPFWDIFSQKLSSENSYQRNIGIMLIAENTRWDKANKIESTIDEYLMLLNDDKPITVRQCIQALSKIIPYKNHLHLKIADGLMSINILEVRDTMRKVILLDILGILAEIRKYQTTDEIENYIFSSLSGEILDKRAKKQIDALL